MHNKSVRALYFIATTIALAGCDGKPADKVVDTGESMVLATANETGVSPCDCTQAQSVSVVNPDTSTRFANVEIIVRESATNNLVSQTTRKFFVDPKMSSFAGCTIDKNPICKFKVNYRIVDDARIKTSTTAATLAFGPFFTPDINTCFSVCNDPNDTSCLRLGQEARKVTQPFAEVYARAVTTGAAQITTNELATAYSSSSSNVCERGNVILESDKITNESTNGKSCIYSTQNATNLLGNSTFLEGEIPVRLQGEKLLQFRLNGISGPQEHLRFSDRDLSPRFRFGGSGAEQLSTLYAGAVRTMSVVDGVAYFATANGCVSAPTK